MIQVNHTSIIVPNYELGDNEVVEKHLSYWNKSEFTFEPMCYMYDEEKKELKIPRGVDINYLEKKFDCLSEVNYKPDDYENISIKLKTLPRDDVQKNAISFLIGENDFKYTKKYSQLTLNLATGAGKTYATIAALSLLSMKTMIITHIDRIKVQWYKSLLKFTDLDESYICNISNSKALEKLMELKINKFKIYLVNHGTLQSYAKKHGWDSLSEVFNHLKIGVKIYDEAHLNFANIIKIDLNTNTKKTFYLTATFQRSDYLQQKLFDICFKNIAKYGESTKQEARKHMIYIGFMFNTKPNLGVQSSMFSRFHGFNKLKYSNYQMNNQKFYDTLLYILNYFKDKDGKIMILSSKIEMTESIRDFLIDAFPDKTVSVYHSQIKGEEREKALQADIISTTPQSAGTGVDIPGLRFCIMTEAYSSKVQADQVSGRLREYGREDYTFYIEMVDMGFKKVYDMYKRRLKVFKEKAYKVLELDYEKRTD